MAIAAAVVFLTGNPGGGTTPVVLIQLDGVGHQSGAGVSHFWFNVSAVSSQLVVGCLELHLGAAGGPVSAPFLANLTSSSGSVYASFNSSQSSWTGNGVSDAICTDGGWTSGAASSIHVGDTMSIVENTNRTADSIIVGVSTAIGDSQSQFLLP